MSRPVPRDGIRDQGGKEDRNTVNTIFVRDGIHSVADYNSTLNGVVVVVVVVRFFHDGITRERLELSS